jgi:hypothetical protein
MMYIKDCLRALREYLVVPSTKLKRRVYNVTAMSFTPEELVAAIAKHVPDIRVTYRPDSRQLIGQYHINYVNRGIMSEDDTLLWNVALTETEYFWINSPIPYFGHLTFNYRFHLRGSYSRHVIDIERR